MVRTSRKWTLALTTAVLFALVVSACAPASTPAPAPKAEAPKPAAAAPKAAEAPKPAAAAPKTEAPKPAAEAPKTDAAKPAAPKADAPKPAAAPDPSEWEKTLAAAKKEGKVVVAGPPGTTFRDAMKVFEKRYPEIKLEWQTFTPAPFVARFYQERQAGQFLWDVYITGPTSFDITAKKAGDLLPVRPALMLPEVLDEKVWHGGFKGAFLDNEMQYVFGFMGEENAAVQVNRDVIPKDALNTVKGLSDPKWKGKIAMQDPRIDGGGSARIAHWRGALGEDFARAFLKQEPVLSDDRRQLAEWVVRGQYPIGVFDSQFLVEFQKEGIGKNVVPLGTKQDPGAYRMGTSWGAVRLISKPPDPSAAKVFVNWLLSKEGQTAWVENTRRASRRVDVPRIEGLSPEAGVDYFDIDRESRVPLRDEAIKLAKEILK